jgi:hypothetical protein
VLKYKPSAIEITTKKIREVIQSLLFFLTIPINMVIKKTTGRQNNTATINPIVLKLLKVK